MADLLKESIVNNIIIFLAKGSTIKDTPTTTSSTADWGKDQPDYVCTLADASLEKVYGDHLNLNNGTHFDGRARDRAVWKE